MLESKIEDKLRRLLQRRGAMVWKFVSPGQAGVPDRLVILPGGRCVFIELKTETGRLSPVQKVVIDRMRAQGCDVRVVHGWAEAKAVADEILPGGDQIGV